MNDSIKPDDLDAVIHERVRLAIVSALAVAPELSFNELKEMLERLKLPAEYLPSMEDSVIATELEQESSGYIGSDRRHIILYEHR